MPVGQMLTQKMEVSFSKKEGYFLVRYLWSILIWLVAAVCFGISIHGFIHGKDSEALMVIVGLVMTAAAIVVTATQRSCYTQD